jgi:hypothetical protein
LKQPMEPYRIWKQWKYRLILADLRRRHKKLTVCGLMLIV